MNSPYWQQMEKQPDFNAWKDFYDSCLMCGCDHGCNEWIKEQRTKISLILSILSNPNATTKLEKVTQMDPKKADQIWYRIQWWKMEKFNRDLREGKIE